MEAQTILNAIKRNRFHKLAADSDLRINKGTLHREIKSLGLSLDEKDGRPRRY